MERPAQKLKSLFFSFGPGDLAEEMTSSNLRALRNVSLIVGCLELLTLLAGLLVHAGNLPAYAVGLISVLGCVVLCAVVALLATVWTRRDFHRPAAVTAVVIVTYVLLTVWGATVSLRHYQAHEQMITFYAVQTCFASFFVFRPLVGIGLMSAAFAGFYTMLFYTDGAAGIEGLNYLAVAVLTVCILVGRYNLLLNATTRNGSLIESNKNLQYVSRHDGLTGMRNRAAFREDQSSYYGTPLTVIMTDIDYFKKINDAYGHSAGDEALALVSKCLARHFEEGHTYRYGGDEFLIMLPGMSMEKAEQTMAACQQDITALQVERIPVALRVSAGLAAGTPVDNAALMGIIAEADHRLYLVKKQIHTHDED